MSTDWLGPRMYRPSLEELLRGALAPWTPDVHYITNFRYPSQGGFLSYLHAVPQIADLKLEHEVVAIDPAKRRLTLRQRRTADYDALVSSIALPDLLPMIAGAPADVVDASQRLACSTCVLVNVGVDRADLSQSQMTYFYDEDICLHAPQLPAHAVGDQRAAGTGSIQAEVYFSSKYRPLTGHPDDWIEPVIRDLRRCGLLREDDKILSAARIGCRTRT